MKKTAKGIVAAVAAALAAFGATVPALAETALAHVPSAHAHVATRRVASAEAIASAARALGLAWADVEGVEWHADDAHGAYAVTLETTAGEELTAFVDAATGEARAAVASADAIAAAASSSGLAWADVEGVEWHADGAGDYEVTLFTTAGAGRTAVVDARTGVVRAA